jgi:hypothetical protein
MYMNKSMAGKPFAERRAIAMDAAAKADLRGRQRMQEEATAKPAHAFLDIGTRMTDEWVERTGGDAKSVVDAFRAVRAVAKADRRHERRVGASRLRGREPPPAQFCA